jgi:y4mF family transcriptional regulator
MILIFIIAIISKIVSAVKIIIMNRFGALIRCHRRKGNLTQKELADLAGVGKTAVFDIEHGKETVQLDTLKNVCGALNITITLESPIMKQCEEEIDEKS